MASDSPATFGSQLKRLRMVAGLTQEELAERAGLSARGISDLERGRRSRPYYETVRLLADALALDDADRAALLAAARAGESQGAASDESVAPTELPTPLTAFIGRAQERREICELLGRADVRLVNLTGPGGVGKTRLALQVAADMRPEFANGVYFVPLASLGDPELTLATIAHALGLPDTSDAPPLARLVAHLRNQRLLLVLDNFEHLLPAAPGLSDLLAACPALVVLTTSRSRLRLASEREYVVPPLALPDPNQTADIDGLIESPAAALFLERFAAIAPHVAVSEVDAPAIAEICRRVDGLPLGIELAAARGRHLTLQELAARLQRRLDLLTHGPRDVPARQRTLRGAIAWSYDLLSPAEQRLLRTLAVFAGGWSTADAEALCAEGTGCSLDVLDGLAALVDNSLIYVDANAAGRTRYGMLETIREFAADQLAASGEEDAARRAHAAVMCAYAERANRGLRSGQRMTWTREVAREVDNMRAALAWLLERDETERALALVGNLLWFWDAVARGREGRRWGEAALAKSNADPLSWAYARAALATGQQAWSMGDFASATRLLTHSAERFRALGDRLSLGQTLVQLGSTSLSQGDDATARNRFSESVALLDESEDRWSYALARFMLGDALMVVDPETARECYEASLAEFRSLGDEFGMAIAMTGLGGLAMRAGDYPAARARFEAGLALRRRFKHPFNTAISLTSLGELARREGDHASAMAYLDEGLALFRDLGDAERMAWTLYNIGILHAQQSDADAAGAAFMECLALRAEQGNPAQIAAALAGVARVAVMRGDAERAARLWGALEGIRAAHGVMAPSDEDGVQEQHTLTVIRERLGTTADAFAAGRALPLPEAIRAALE